MGMQSIGSVHQEIQMTVLRRFLDMAAQHAQKLIEQADTTAAVEPDLGQTVDTQV